MEGMILKLSKNERPLVPSLSVIRGAVWVRPGHFAAHVQRREKSRRTPANSSRAEETASDEFGCLRHCIGTISRRPKQLIVSDFVVADLAETARTAPSRSSSACAR